MDLGYHMGSGIARSQHGASTPRPKRPRKPFIPARPHATAALAGGVYQLFVEAFVLPSISSNSRAGWRANHEETKEWDAMLGAMLWDKRPPGGALRVATLQLRRYSLNPPDWDGLAISFKHPVDALVSAGILSDDRISVIGYPECRWEKAKTRAEQRIVMVVTGPIGVHAP